MSSSPTTTRAVPGAPAGRAVKTAAVSSTAKRALIALGVATYLGATAAATVYGSAALYMLFHKQRPAGISAVSWMKRIRSAFLWKPPRSMNCCAVSGSIT